MGTVARGYNVASQKIDFARVLDRTLPKYYRSTAERPKHLLVDNIALGTKRIAERNYNLANNTMQKKK